MTNGKIIAGILFFIIGIVCGLYLGFWLLFVGGFVDIINAIKEPIVDVTSVGFGLIKIICSGVVGTLTFWFFALISAVMLSSHH